MRNRVGRRTGALECAHGVPLGKNGFILLSVPFAFACTRIYMNKDGTLEPYNPCGLACRCLTDKDQRIAGRLIGDQTMLSQRFGKQRREGLDLGEGKLVKH